MEMVLESQRYGRNKSTTINHTYINSGEYRKKFDKITDNLHLNRLMYTKAKEMLEHRSGTRYEDMCWFDSEKTELIAQEFNSIEEEQILYSESINKAIISHRNIIAMHTHPCSMPPSIADFNSCNEHGYDLGIVLCHDGKIYCYKSSENISKTMYNLYVADYYNQLHDEHNAQLNALKELGTIYDIEFWEVE
ncbi:MAG: hypothetical protein IKN85_06745 [Oscillospiraceae bacterium]|nr:hypothetical protein [Oscillospiraceae bacterium]MBR6835615.1 hypothetical protein [Oscillospiraceae bacterium]